jgi:hypothetical protein
MEESLMATAEEKEFTPEGLLLGGIEVESLSGRNSDDSVTVNPGAKLMEWIAGWKF